MVREVELLKIPERLETVAVLGDSVLQRLNESIKRLNERARLTLEQFGSRNGELTGSSPFMQVYLQNQGILSADVERLTTREDLERALTFNPTFSDGIYIDCGLALRTAGDSYMIEGVKVNDKIAKHLAQQLNGKGIALGRGKLIPFSALTSPEDPESFYGLTFSIPEQVLDMKKEDIEKHIRDLDSYTWDYARKGGVSCAVLFDWGWVSDFERLHRSLDFGRVGIVRAAGTAQKFEERLADYKAKKEEAKANYTANLTALRDELNAELETK